MVLFVAWGEFARDLWGLLAGKGWSVYGNGKERKGRVWWGGGLLCPLLGVTDTWR